MYFLNSRCQPIKICFAYRNCIFFFLYFIYFQIAVSIGLNFCIALLPRIMVKLQMFYQLTVLILYIYVICSLNTTMCLHKNIKCYDDLERPVDINWQFDKYDDCDYINLENTVNVTDKDLSDVQLNIRGLSSKINDLNHLIDHLQTSGQPPSL